MKLIVGLGNPGKEYENTRHNIGFKIIDNFLGDISFKEKFNGLSYKVNINNVDVLFIKPLTYMNLSGNCVKKYMDYYNIDIKDILIIQDDISIELGKIRIKNNSSAGGHNGIKSIIENIKSDEFSRLKIGVKTEKLSNASDFVLDKFSKTEMDLINQFDYKEIINTFISEGLGNYSSEYCE